MSEISTKIQYSHVKTSCAEMHIITTNNVQNGARGGVVVKTLRHKPAGRGFDSRWYHWNFSMT